MKALAKTILKTCCLLKELRGQSRPQPLQAFDPRAVKRILAVSCTAIGDTLFATPSVRALRHLLPHARIDFLVRDRFLPLFVTNSWTDSTLAYKGRYKGWLSLLRQIKEQGYDLCIIFHDSDPCPAQVAFLAGIPFIFRIGLRDENTSRYLSSRMPYDLEKHAIDQRLEVIRRIFKVRLDEESDLRMDLPVDLQRSESLWQDILKKMRMPCLAGKKIGFQFSASGDYKKWPEEHFITLGKRLLRHSHRPSICLIGGPRDRKVAKRIEAALTEEQGAAQRVVNLAGAIGIKDLAEMIHGLDLLITNDTGPLHVAIAIGTPTISLFVPSSYKATGPIQDLDIHKVIHKSRPCRPCFEKYCKEPHCMGLIPVEEVFEAAIESLDAKTPLKRKAPIAVEGDK